MFAKRLIALFAALVLGFSTVPAQAQSHTRGQIETLAQFYAQYYDVPLELVRRVINRESTFNPSARNGPYYGLMQILPATARTMGFRGEPSDLLNAETNLIYAVKYLRGAWLLAGGSHDRAVQLYAKGYYYEAKAAGLLEQTGLRPGPASPVAPTPPTGLPPVMVAAAPVPAPVAEVVDVIQTAAISPVPASAEIVPLGFLPPARPLGLVFEEAEAPASEALVAIAAAEAPSAPRAVPARPDFGPSSMTALAYAPSLDRGLAAMRRAESAMLSPAPAARIAQVAQLRPSIDLIASTFDLLESLAPAAQ
ncbi:transglycosylase SLT domain-containing protein [Pelagibacterium lacus]|uniref:Lytic transglycosylase domain-containing protein n=1 Tax=Pelagibacterium lacus TaxID=2282655 RepID=A0A369W5W1_9HYPH|nr:lytic transglycosylase domain-containing protein [Pelagibacterium lacus]RDE09409.1 lytic transglycosylase domain-containing protein [Pelagibacterium lacus]